MFQIPAVVQEGEVFGAVVDAVDVCFEGVRHYIIE